MKLSERHLEVLKHASHRAGISVAKLAEGLPYREHAIRRILDELLSSGYIKRSIFVNFFKLGFSCQNVFFSMPSWDLKTRAQVISWICAYPNLTWFAEVAGRFQYQLTMLCKNPGDLGGFLEQMSSRFGCAFQDRSSSCEIVHNVFGRKFLGERRIDIPPITFSETQERVEIDEMDWRLLSLLASPGGESLSQIARVLKMPLTTLNYRKARLEEAGVLTGIIYLINRNVTDYVSFDVLIQVGNLAPSFVSKFLEYCRDQPNIYHCHRCVGDWDYKMCIEGLPRDQLVELIESLRRKFSDHIHSMEVIPILREFRDVLCPVSH